MTIRAIARMIEKLVKTHQSVAAIQQFVLWEAIFGADKSGEELENFQTDFARMCGFLVVEDCDIF